MRAWVLGIVASLACLGAQAQTVIKPLSRLFQQLPGISGSAILGTGRVALVLELSPLLRKLLPSAVSTVA